MKCQSLQGFSYLLTNDTSSGEERVIFACQSLQGFSYLLTQIMTNIRNKHASCVNPFKGSHIF